MARRLAAGTGKSQAAGQLYFARGLPVLERERAEWIVAVRDGRVVVVRRR
jgi:hypothetical protein